MTKCILIKICINSRFQQKDFDFYYGRVLRRLHIVLPINVAFDAMQKTNYNLRHISKRH